MRSLVRHAQQAAADVSGYVEEGLPPREAAVLRAFLRDGRFARQP